jgi:LPXTG-site transpeptidase (sortase) family protein
MTKDLIICALSSLNILMFSFIGFNYEAFKKMNEYQASTKELPNFDHVAWQIIRNASPQESPISSPEEKTLAMQPADTTTFLSIPKLNLLAPIKHSSNHEDISKSLEQGVLSLNSWPNRQTVLFGHSSDYPWRNNPFGTVFTLIPQLQPGDEILLTNNTSTSRYTVKSTQITDSKLTGLIGNTTENELILSTCYPIGFFSKRFNVIAEPTEKSPTPISKS